MDELLNTTTIIAILGWSTAIILFLMMVYMSTKIDKQRTRINRLLSKNDTLRNENKQLKKQSNGFDENEVDLYRTENGHRGFTRALD